MVNASGAIRRHVVTREDVWTRGAHALSHPPLAPAHWVDHDAHDAPAPRCRWLSGVVGLAAAIFSTDEGPPPEPRLRWLAAQVDDFLGRVGAKSRVLFRLSLWVVTWIAPLWAFRPGPLSWWPVERRLLALERFERSPLGPTVLMLKAILCILYYEHPDAARAIGFDGGCLHRSEEASPAPEVET